MFDSVVNFRWYAKAYTRGDKFECPNEAGSTWSYWDGTTWVGAGTGMEVICLYETDSGVLIYGTDLDDMNA